MAESTNGRGPARRSWRSRRWKFEIRVAFCWIRKLPIQTPQQLPSQRPVLLKGGRSRDWRRPRECCPLAQREGRRVQADDAGRGERNVRSAGGHERRRMLSAQPGHLVVGVEPASGLDGGIVPVGLQRPHHIVDGLIEAVRRYGRSAWRASGLHRDAPELYMPGYEPGTAGEENTDGRRARSGIGSATEDSPRPPAVAGQWTGRTLHETAAFDGGIGRNCSWGGLAGDAGK